MERSSVRLMLAGCVFSFVVGLAGALPVLAQDDGGGAGGSATEGPTYSNLRYDDDLSYLTSGGGDFFDPIKNIDLGGDWSLSLGGEFRYRLESETDRAGFGAAARSTDSFSLFRFLLHADVKYGDAFRVFAQGITAFDEDRDLGRRGTDENMWDVQQLFFDVRLLGEDLPLTLRVGRQELLYGSERLVSPLDWASVRRRFDAIKLFAHGETWDVDLWYAKPVPVRRNQRDRFEEQFDFWGAYATYKGIDGHGLDIYLFYVDDIRNTLNPNGSVGDRGIYTLGSRFWGTTGDFDYETELSGQWGHWGPDRVRAWSWALDGGYTFSDATWKPRLGAGFDWSTGDDNPADGTVGTFDQLFPLGHAFFGYLDLVGRQNMTSVNVNLSAWPVEDKVQAGMAYHTFWLTENEDALYSASGAALRRDPMGRSASGVGSELDLTINWKICPHSSVLFGYSHFWNGSFITQTGVSDDPDLFYVQYALKF